MDVTAQNPDAEPRRDKNTNRGMLFGTWFKALQRLAARHGLAITDREGWRGVYNSGANLNQAFYEKYPECVSLPVDPAALTREDYEDIEHYALGAMMGHLSCGGAGHPTQVAKDAFDVAEAMLAEKKKRLGDKPDYNHGA